MTTKQMRNELFEKIRAELYVAVVSDVLDDLGLTEQAMSASVRPLDDSLSLLGYARTGLYHDVYRVEEGENPYDLEIALVDDLKPGEVAVLGCGNSDRIAPWGELLSTAARIRGSSGCITDGYVRDIRAIRAMGFSVFHGGIAPLDSKGRGKLAQIDTPVVCGNVLVETGDLIFGDADGVVVIPKAHQDEVLDRAFKKVTGENLTRQGLMDGASLREIYQKYGVL